MGISTPAQRELAWRYAHKGMVIIDGAFGVSSKLVMCFIVFAVDGDNRGNPLLLQWPTLLWDLTRRTLFTRNQQKLVPATCAHTLIAMSCLSFSGQQK